MQQRIINMGHVGKRFIYVAIVTLLVGCQSSAPPSVVEQSLKEQLARQIAHEQASQNSPATAEGSLESVPKNVSDLLSEVPVSGQPASLFGPEKYDIEADGEQGFFSLGIFQRIVRFTLEE